MAALTLAGIREVVRTNLDLDSDDIPDLLVDTWAQEGYDLSIAAEPHWRFFEVVQTFATVANTQGYSLAAIDPAAPLQSVYAIRGPRWDLLPVAQRLAETAFNAQTATTREPNYFSQWAGLLNFWPTPDDAYTMTVRGHRQPLDWIAGGAGATPDCPVEFHRVILTWVLSRAYLQQDDPSVAQMLEIQFGNQIRALRGRFIQAPPSGPILMNQGEIQGGPIGRLRFDWE